MVWSELAFKYGSSSKTFAVLPTIVPFLLEESEKMRIDESNLDYFADYMLLKLIVVGNLVRLSLNNSKRNMNKLWIDDRLELTDVVIAQRSKFDIVDYSVVMEHQAMCHSDVEYRYSVDDRYD